MHLVASPSLFSAIQACSLCPKTAGIMNGSLIAAPFPQSAQLHQAHCSTTAIGEELALLLGPVLLRPLCLLLAEGF